MKKFLLIAAFTMFTLPVISGCGLVDDNAPMSQATQGGDCHNEGTPCPPRDSHHE